MFSARSTRLFTSTPDERRRHQAEEGERGVAPSDGGGIEEGAPEPTLRRELVQRRPRIGDGHELHARLGGPAAFDLGAEIVIERGRLQRGARLGGDHEQRLGKIDPLEHALHRARVGGVEHEKVGEAHLGAEGEVEDLGREGGAAHAQQHHVRVREPPDLVGEVAEILGRLAHEGGDGEPAEAVTDLVLVSRPERGVLGPEPAPEVLLLERLQRGAHRRMPERIRGERHRGGSGLGRGRGAL